MIKHKGEVIAKEVSRNKKSLDGYTRCLWGEITKGWHTVWHGTKFSNLESILRYGILPSGTKLPSGASIVPPRNHYKMDETHFSINKWGRAIFLSPSISYAANLCYSERIFSDQRQWCVLVKAYVEPSSFTIHIPTVADYDPVIEGEPEFPEYRIEVEADCKIFRVESVRKVVVQSIVFLSLDFLEKNTHELTFDEIQDLFSN